MAVYPASDVCNEALAADGLRWMTSHPGWVTEALRRDLTVEKCAAMVGRKNIMSSSAPTETTPSSPKVRPIAIEWEGYGKLIAGQIELNQRNEGGKISLKLPNSEGDCTGSYNFSSKSKGNWALACTNGMAATGTFESFGTNKGSSGEGTDTKGRKVKYTIGAGQS